MSLIKYFDVAISKIGTCAIQQASAKKSFRGTFLSNSIFPLKLVTLAVDCFLIGILPLKPNTCAGSQIYKFWKLNLADA